MTDNPITPETIVAQLRALRADIPDYTQLQKAARRSMITVARNTDPDFVQAAINTVGASVNVQQALGQTAEELRTETADAQAWTAVEDEARALLQGVSNANLVRSHRIGRKALTSYAISRRLSMQPEHADLLPHVQVMKQLNRFGIRKRAKAASTPPVAPEPPEPPSATS